jgi:N-glycosylase/DNA lyase
MPDLCARDRTPAGRKQTAPERNRTPAGRKPCIRNPASRSETEAALFAAYEAIRERVRARIGEFTALWERGSDGEIFSELVFCLLTPGSKARSAAKALDAITQTGLLYGGGVSELAPYFNVVRFKNNKALNVVRARELFFGCGGRGIKKCLLQFKTVHERREWLVQRVRGMGYKEASHFLRNIGFCDGISILDRHVLKNLHALGLIDEIPESLTRRRYFAVEEAMKGYSKEIGIPLSHLDFVFWYRETGEIFK